jgi:N-acylneuraminate cytidylyltransferase
VKTLAIILARGGSKRLPGKNVRPFLGRPLIHWTIEFARGVRRFDSIVVSTDSDEIAACSATAGINVPTRRPVDLASDTASSVDVALDALERAGVDQDFDLVALLQPTTPLRNPQRWEQAYALMQRAHCDAVIGVSAARDHPSRVFCQAADGLLTPWHRADLNARSQDLAPVFAVNGGLYLIRAQVLRELRTFFPPATYAVVCDGPCENIDIDTEADWLAAESLVTHYGPQS